MNRKNIEKIIYTFLLLQPFLDFFTSLMVRFTNIPITIGMLVRGSFLVFTLVYMIFFTKSKYKKKSIIFLSIIFLFFIFYLLTKGIIFDIASLKIEIIYAFKYFYFPIITVCLINIFSELNIEKEKVFKIFIINIMVYSLLILIPEITGTSFSSYLDSSKGTVGWFYAANEIGALMVVLFPFMYFLLFNRESLIKSIILFIIVIISMTLLGTKTSFIGMIVAEIIYFIYYLINYKKNRGLGLKICTLIILVSYALVPNIPAIKNMKKAINDNNKIEIEDKIVIDAEIKEKYKMDIDTKKILKVVLSGRDDFFLNTYDIYKNSNFIDKLFGIGFVNRNVINNKNIEKLIEIDPLDILFHYGIIGFILYSILPIYILFKVLCLIIQRKFKLSFFDLTNLYCIMIISAASFVAGHIYGAPSVSIYIAISYALICKKISNSNVQFSDRKKITIFALHLGYGGVEKYLSSLCKMLENDYEIEIIVTYKVLDKPAFYFSNKIKITYLIDGKPNKEEFKNAIKEKNVFKVFKEGFKSLKILYLKRTRNIKSIRNTYSDYIITTRTFHNKLVGYYAFDNIIKIATEHNYHNNDKKYINRLIYSIKGFDYFVVVSNELRNFYNDKIGKTKCIYIPNVVENIPKYYVHEKINNRLISIGRLSSEKGYNDLIDVIKIIKEKIPNIKLDIYGDGIEKEKLNNQIDNLSLRENIKLCGFLNQNDIFKKMKNYDIYVMSSHTESFGLVLIEAMSNSLPCIAFDSASGAREILKNNNGILIDNRDKKKMADKIIYLLRNNKEKEKISKKAYNSVEEYSIVNVKKIWLKLLNDIRRKENNEK